MTVCAAQAARAGSAAMQFFERPEELMTGDQQDDLLFFVVHEAYQVILPTGTQPCAFQIACLSATF